MYKQKLDYVGNGVLENFEPREGTDEVIQVLYNDKEIIVDEGAIKGTFVAFDEEREIFIYKDKEFNQFLIVIHGGWGAYLYIECAVNELVKGFLRSV